MSEGLEVRGQRSEPTAPVRFMPGMRIPVQCEPIPIGFPVEIRGQAFTVVARTKRGLALRRQKVASRHGQSEGGAQ